MDPQIVEFNPEEESKEATKPNTEQSAEDIKVQDNVS